MVSKPIKIQNSSAVTLVGSKRARKQSNLNESEMADLNILPESLIVVPNQSEPIKIQASVKEQPAKETDQKNSNQEVLSNEDSHDLTAKESLDLTSKRSKNMTHISVRRHVEAIHDSQMLDEERENNPAREDTDSAEK